MEGFRQIDTKDILGPVYDATPGGPPPADVRDDYLASYAGDRFVESARYVRTYPTELPKLAEQLATIKTPKSCAEGMTRWFRHPIKTFFTSDCPIPEWTCCQQSILHGRKFRTCTATFSSNG